MDVDPAHSDSIAKLYQDHHGWLHGWLRRKIRCSHQAADLTHDTFMRLLVREEPIFIQEPRAFLTTVAQRVLANHWRRKQIEQAYFEMLAQNPEASVLPPEECAILLETLLEIDRLLNGLPLPVKRAFLYAQLDGMSHTEIAAELNVSITTVKRYLIKAGAQCYFALVID